MKDHIILSVPKGSRVIDSNGSAKILSEVPENALDLIESGTSLKILAEQIGRAHV